MQFFRDHSFYKNLHTETQGPYYLIDEKKFIRNYTTLSEKLNISDAKFIISYSVKTNYLPPFLNQILQNGGCVEVVSEMELDLVTALGFEGERILVNGPFKSYNYISKAIKIGSVLNIDSLDDLKNILNVMHKSDHNLFANVGVRLNYEILGKKSRFGVNIGSHEFDQIFQTLKYEPNLKFRQIHTHFQERSLLAWKSKLSILEEALDMIASKYEIVPDSINYGGGMYGPMQGEIRNNFDFLLPEYDDYVDLFLDYSHRIQEKLCSKFTFHVEPGTAIVADCVEYVSEVYSIKEVDGDYIATLNGSLKDLAAHSGRIPTDILVVSNTEVSPIGYEKMILVGNTCLETDIIIGVENIKLSVGDLLVFPYCGAYSIVMRPSFIHYMPPIYALIDDHTSDVRCEKPKQTLLDVFGKFTYFDK